METIVLDPIEVAHTRAELEINTGAIQVSQGGIDWGNAEITAYMAEQSRGSSPVDYRLPNRQIQIPLTLRTSGTVTFDQARSKLAAKVARIQQEGGWLKRVISGGGTLYADIVNASLNLPGGWLQANRDAENEAMLSLEAIPDFYGEEIELSDHVETTLPELTFTETGIKGDYPGRVRIVVDEDSAQNQRGLIWAFRSRHYSSASTAASAYQAEALQPLDTATKVAKVGASGGTVVTHGTISTHWTPVVGTNIGGATFLTHTGTNRIFARVLTTSGTLVQSRFVWDVGDLVYPVENDAVRCYDGGTFHILDLGEVRLDPVPTGDHRWQGQIQAKGDAGTENFSVDRVWIVNADEAMGVLRAPSMLSAGLVNYSARDEFNQSAGDLTGKVAPTGGTWSETGEADGFILNTASKIVTKSVASDSDWHFARLGAATPSALALAADLGISGVSGGVGLDACVGLFCRYVDLSNNLRAFIGKNELTEDSFIAVEKEVATTVTRLLTVPLVADDLTSGERNRLILVVTASGQWTFYRGSASPVRLGSGFDPVLATGGALDDGGFGLAAYAPTTAATVSADNFAAWVPTDDAVIYASQSAELSTHAHLREDSGGTAYGPVSYVTGDLPRIPPAGLEGRTVEGFVKASRGDIQTLTDPAIDDISAHVYYRPSWLSVPES